MRADDLALTGRMAFHRLRWLGPCDRLSIFDDLVLELHPDIRRLIDPWPPAKFDQRKFGGIQPRDAQQLSDDLMASVLGGAVLEIARLELDPADIAAKSGKRKDEQNFEIKALSKAIDVGVRAGLNDMSARLKAHVAAYRNVAALFE